MVGKSKIKQDFDALLGIATLLHSFKCPTPAQDDSSHACSRVVASGMRGPTEVASVW